MKRQRFKASQRLSRRPACEVLESRLALDGSGSALESAEALTLSFVPDGTTVQNQTSSLVANLAGQSNLPDWQQTIARAFQTWAQHADINVGLVSDGGQALGIRGQTHGDPRFGDIRVAGIPLSPDTLGEATGAGRLVAGTWAGDVVLNTANPFPSSDKLFEVALHEAGHALGLGHSTDPNSPMFAHEGSVTNGPTADDIAILQALYGPRRPDVFEGSNGNDTITRASRIPHAELVDGFDGSTPLVVYGDIHDATDKDVYLLPVLAGYQGSLTFQLWTSGISLLQGKISVVDQNDNVLATAQSSSDLGDVLTVHLASTTAERLYIRVESAGTDVFAAGRYGLVVKYDQLITTPDAQIQAAVLAGNQWSASTDDSAAAVDVRALLTSGTPQLDNDQHTNDDPKQATALSPVFDSAALRKFRFVGTISDGTDTDVYQLRSQPAASAARGLTVAVETLPGSTLVPQITILDKSGLPIATTMFANGDGLIMIRAANIQANQDYLVSISGSSTGNYAVTATYDDVAPSRTVLTSGTLSAQTPDAAANLYVAKPQLFSFALSSQTTSGAAPGQTIWATVYDDKRRPVAFLGSIVGQLRSVQSVMLEPGTYHIHFEGRDATGQAAVNASYQFYADAVSDALGSVLIDTGSTGLFVCLDDGSGAMFCYPDNPPGTNPFGTGPSGAPLIDPTTLINPPTDVWFAATIMTPTNPSNSFDVDGDGSVSPNDALMVINAINAFGSAAAPIPPVFRGYLDTSGDGFISPIDALRVINLINRRPGGEGEPAPVVPLAPALVNNATAAPSMSLTAMIDLLAIDAANSVAVARPAARPSP